MLHLDVSTRHLTYTQGYVDILEGTLNNFIETYQKYLLCWKNDNIFWSIS